MTEILLVQFYPLNRNVGRFLYTTKENKSHYKSFINNVNASDLEHNSIVLRIDIRLREKVRTRKEIKHLCCEILDLKE